MSDFDSGYDDISRQHVWYCYVVVFMLLFSSDEMRLRLEMRDLYTSIDSIVRACLLARLNTGMRQEFGMARASWLHRGKVKYVTQAYSCLYLQLDHVWSAVWEIIRVAQLDVLPSTAAINQTVAVEAAGGHS